MHSQPLKVKKYFEWFEKNYSILSPTFSHSDTEIVFTKQFQSPEGPSAPEGYFDSISLIIDKNPRFADPVICLLNIPTKAVTKIDYGWTADFSPDDNLIVYDFQTFPISGKRALATPLKGNEIKVYDKRTKQTEVIAYPDTTFLLNPVFLDGDNILYQIGNAVNGAYGGGVALCQSDLKSKICKTVYSIKKSFGNFHLIGDIHRGNQKIYFTVYIPLDGDEFMANNYSHLLLSLDGKTVQNFGKRDFNSLEGKLGIDTTGAFIYVDDNHEMISQKDNVIKYRNKKVIYKKSLSAAYMRGFLSPTGKFLFYTDDKEQCFLMETDNFEKTKLPLSSNLIQDVIWSENSNKFGVVQVHENLSQTDLLTLFEVN